MPEHNDRRGLTVPAITIAAILAATGGGGYGFTDLTARIASLEATQRTTAAELARRADADIAERREILQRLRDIERTLTPRHIQ